MNPLGGMGNLMRKAQKQMEKLQKQMEEIQRSLKERTVEGSAGGGMVKAIVNGQKELLSVKIDPEVINADDVEMLEDLIVAAVSQAMKKAEEIHEEEMSKLTGGLKLPGLF